MSSVFVHVGQCGNQLGQAFWSEVDEWYGPGRRRRGPTANPRPPPLQPLPFSLLDGTLPCVLVDTEPKVIRQRAQSSVLVKRVPDAFRLTGKTGRGGNWAYGYRGAPVSSSGCGSSGCGLSEVVECVRRVVEKCDRFSGTVMLHSIAGGTGSGLGSAIAERLRDEYPLAHFLSISVAPFVSGESPLQHYNTLLSLRWLQNYSDAVVLFQNDRVLQQAEKCTSVAARECPGGTTHEFPKGPGGSGSRGGGVSLWDMNRHISGTLCSSLLPVEGLDKKLSKPHINSNMEPWELVRSLCPDPTLKLISPAHAEQLRPSTTWNQLLSCVSPPSTPRSASADVDTAREKPTASSLVCIARSSPANMEELLRNVNTVERKLKQSYNTVEWNPFPVDFWMSQESHLRERKMITVLANSSVVSGYLEKVLHSASVMYQSRAYLHWYERYRCSAEVIGESLEAVRSMAEDYTCLK